MSPTEFAHPTRILRRFRRRLERLIQQQRDTLRETEQLRQEVERGK
jgi:hypothetical protein